MNELLKLIAGILAIFLAVSNLSPVKTQIFIPADLKSFIVSGTLSCNLSSTTVPPIKVKLFSIIS